MRYRYNEGGGQSTEFHGCSRPKRPMGRGRRGDGEGVRSRRQRDGHPRGVGPRTVTGTGSPKPLPGLSTRRRPTKRPEAVVPVGVIGVPVAWSTGSEASPWRRPNVFPPVASHRPPSRHCQRATTTTTAVTCSVAARHDVSVTTTSPRRRISDRLVPAIRDCERMTFSRLSLPSSAR